MTDRPEATGLAVGSSDAVLSRLRMRFPPLIDLGLERIKHVLSLLGHPEKQLPPVIHVAGTNGKGSAIAYMKAILEAAGKSVHRNVSPHLVRFHERIHLAGKDISEDALIALLLEVERTAEQETVTYFEIITAAAFLAYARHEADVLLLEVGLGGRLDATNVIDRPALSVITPIDLDHQRFLGDTVEAIAREKAGILKPGVPAVIGPQSDAVRDVLEDCADEVGAPLIIHGQEFTAYEEHGRLVYQDERGLLDLPLPKLVGRHQIDNAGTAIACLRALDWLDITQNQLEAGLETVTWPARMQRLSAGPLVDLTREAGIGKSDRAELWLDGGHNPHAARAVAQSLADLEERVARPLYLIVGMLDRKDAAGFLEAFVGLARQVTTVPVPGHEDTIDPDKLGDTASRLKLTTDAAPDVVEALAKILQATRGETAPRILICGSLHLASDVLSAHR